MQVLAVRFVVDRDHAEDFAAAIVANARASRDAEPGCRRFDVCRDPADPAVFFLYELYDDDAAIDAHLRSPHFVQMSRDTAAWVVDKTVWRGVRVDPPGGG